MRSLLEYIPAEVLHTLTITCGDTRFNLSSLITGSAAELMTRKLGKRGAAHLLPAESFFVEGMHGPLKSGELERAVTWAQMLHEQSNIEQISMS